MALEVSVDIRIAKITLILGILAIVAIRAPFGRESAKIKIIRKCRTPLEVGLLMLMWLASVILRRRPTSSPRLR